MLNRTNRTLSANLNRLNLGTRSLASQASLVNGAKSLPTRHAFPVVMRAGMVGVPWFAGGAAGYRAATLGYLVGFVLAAALVGWLAARGGDRRPLRTAGTMAAGTILIYLTGAAWLVAGLGLAPSTAVAVGVGPFIPGDILKAVLAMGLLPAAWRLAGRFTGRQP